MTLPLEWPEIALRLALTVLAGFLIGLNREEHGHAAGMRTTILVCLAASVSMLQVNLLLGLAGKHPDSFIVMDLMRLPLGILSGMGFIGAGAILRRSRLISGVTTAATLWFVTVIGLCLGGCQLVLGMVSLAIALGVLWGLKAFELHLRQERAATLVVISGAGAPGDAEIRARLQAAGFATRASAVSHLDHLRQRRLTYSVRWRARPTEVATPGVVEELARQAGVQEIDWLPDNAELAAEDGVSRFGT